MEVQVLRVMASEESSVALLFGQPTNDSTKVVVAGLDRDEAIAFAKYANELDGPVLVDVPEWAVLAVLELP